MARVRERVVAGFFAALFLGTSFTLSIAVIMQMIQDSHNKAQSQEISTQVADIKSKSKDSNMDNKLQGTDLANYTPGQAVTGLKTEDTVVGTGDKVKPGDTVTVDYTGALASTGKIFESSKDGGHTATFGLDQVIKGWTEGLPGMKVGGTRRLIIPAAMAYGSQGSGSIPPNSDLVFDVTLHSVQK